jgi:hypothetical protein
MLLLSLPHHPSNRSTTQAADNTGAGTTLDTPPSGCDHEACSPAGCPQQLPLPACVHDGGASASECLRVPASPPDGNTTPASVALCEGLEIVRRTPATLEASQYPAAQASLLMTSHGTSSATDMKHARAPPSKKITKVDGALACGLGAKSSGTSDRQLHRENLN